MVRYFGLFIPSLILCFSIQAQRSDELHPSWSPDQKKVVFFSNKKGNNDIFILSLDNNKTQQITIDAGDNGNPVWSPDGKEIAFHSDRNGNYDIFIYNLENKSLLELTSEAHDQMSPAWSPDAKFIAFDSAADSLWRTDILELSSGELDSLFLENGEYLSPTWHPNGQLMVSRSAIPGNHDTALEIIMIDIKTRKTEWITKNSGGSSNASISSKGALLSFNNVSEGNWEVYLLDLTNNSEAIRVTVQNEIDGQPSVSPDGTKILFTSNREGNFDLLLFTLKNSKLLNLTKDWEKE